MDKNMIKIFKSLAEIDSVSGEEEKISLHLSQAMEKLGMPLKRDSGGNLFFSGKDPKILFQAHVDTVEPGRGIKVKVLRDKLVSAGNTILGADNKAGLAIILSVLVELPTELRSRVEVLFTVREEEGLVGIKTFDTRKIKSAFGISLDKSDYKFGGCVVIGGVQAEKFTIKLTGNAHHSTRPNAKENPLILFLDVFSKLQPGYLDKDTTFNIGKISGFEQLNSTPRQLMIKGDIRAKSLNKIEGFYKKIHRLSKEAKSEARLQIEREVVAEKYRISTKRKHSRFIIESLRSFKYVPLVLDKGSVTEAAILSAKGIPTYLLSCGVYKTHTVDEYVHVQEMLKAKEFLSHLVRNI